MNTQTPALNLSIAQPAAGVWICGPPYFNHDLGISSCCATYLRHITVSLIINVLCSRFDVRIKWSSVQGLSCSLEVCCRRWQISPPRPSLIPRTAQKRSQNWHPMKLACEAATWRRAERSHQSWHFTWCYDIKTSVTFTCGPNKTSIQRFRCPIDATPLTASELHHRRVEVIWMEAKIPSQTQATF